jgi:flagellar biosynthesis/type III secretory pathway chaperone
MTSDTELHAAYCLVYLKGKANASVLDLTDMAKLKAQHAQLLEQIEEARRNNADNLPALQADLRANELILSTPEGSSQKCMATYRTR